VRPDCILDYFPPQEHILPIIIKLRIKKLLAAPPPWILIYDLLLCDAWTRASEGFQGGPKVVKSHFIYSKLRKTPFVAKTLTGKRKISKSRGGFPLAPFPTVVPGLSMATRAASCHFFLTQFRYNNKIKDNYSSSAQFSANFCLYTAFNQACCKQRQ